MCRRTRWERNASLNCRFRKDATRCCPTLPRNGEFSRNCARDVWHSRVMNRRRPAADTRDSGLYPGRVSRVTTRQSPRWRSPRPRPAIFLERQHAVCAGAGAPLRRGLNAAQGVFVTTRVEPTAEAGANLELNDILQVEEDRRPAVERAAHHRSAAREAR